MKNTWLRFISFFLSVLLFLSLNVASAKEQSSQRDRCSFPESLLQPFFFDLLSDTPPQSIIVDTVVEPPNVELEIANIRSNNLPDIDFTDHFFIELRSTGQFLVVSQKSLALPNYPSSVNETLLYTTITCNGHPHPLITMRIKAANTHTPLFYNSQPYEMTVFKGSKVDRLFATPILALDKDPAANYPIKYTVEGSSNEFSLTTAEKMSVQDLQDTLKVLPDNGDYSLEAGKWTLEKLPPMVYLKVKSRLSRSVYYLNISAADGGEPERKAYAQLKVMVKEESETTAHFTQNEYFANFTRTTPVGTDLIPNLPISAFFPQQSSSQPAANRHQARAVVYELVDTNPHSQLLTIDSSTARLQLNQVAEYESTPSNVELQIKAYLADQPEKYVLARLVLNDVTEVKLTHFEQCHYEAHLLENPSAYTKVLQFNFKGDVEGVELLNGTEYFAVDSDGTMSVKSGVKIDREEIQQIVVKARLKSQSSLHPKSLELCQIASANILIDDQNDHTPRFEKTAYTFRIDTLPYNNTEVGTLKAVDKDKGEFGRVHYRILDEEYEPIPFTIFQADGAATIYYVTRKHDYFPEKSYTFTLEAYDAEVDPRTSRVSVHVLLEAEKADQQTESAIVSKDHRDTSSNGSEEDDRVQTQRPVEEESDEERLTEEPTTSTTPPARGKGKPHSKGKHYRAAGHKTTVLKERDQEVKKSEERMRMSSEMVGSEEREQDGRRKNVRVEETMQIVQEQAHSLHSPHVKIVNKDTRKQTKKKFNAQETALNTFNPNSKLSKSSSIKFSAENYNFSLKGKLDEGQYIGQIHIDVVNPSAANQKQQLDYAVEEGIAGFVEIDSYTGSLSVGRELVKDSYEEIRFLAAVQSQGEVLATTLVTVVMDDNASIYDIPPAFEQSLYRFEAEENQQTGRIGKVEAHHRAVELGKDRLWYVLERNSKEHSPFRIETETGWLSNREPLDAEIKRTYNLKISACLETNTSSCARAQVVVIVSDTNDNAPEFNRSSFDISIPLNLPIGSELVRVRATDADTGKNAEISYSLRTSYAFQALFEIDPKSGAITLAKKLNGYTGGNVEPGTVYRIEVDATDHGQPPMSASTSIKITAADINPSSPEFDKFRYEVVFNASSIPQNTLITQVHATDPDGGMDGKVVYRFADANDQATNSNNGAEEVVKNYSIDSQTGKITSIVNILPQATTFDADNQGNGNDHHSLTHLLVVEAMDQSLEFARRSQTVVMIKINAPQQDQAQPTEVERRVEFNPLPKTVFISSAKPLNSTILRVSAKVIDAKNSSVDPYLQSRITYSVVGADENTEETFFTILNDQLSVSKSLGPNEYDIKIRAEVEGMEPTYHSIHIVVMNDRDKYPVFERLSYEMQVEAEDIQFPVKMAALNATVTNGRIAYSILSPKHVKGIDVDKITGQLTLFEQPCTETFVVVRAVNLDYSSFFSDVGVTLTVDKSKKKSSSTLSFDSKLYRLIAKEGQAAGSVINTLALSVLNPDHLADIQYKFEPASHDFGILPNGSVIVKRRLEADNIEGMDDKGVVELKVVAQSGEDGPAVKSTVQIAIEKVQASKPPVFDQSEYVFVLNSPVQSGHPIGQLKARSSAEGLPISFRVVSGTAQPYFQLNQNDGTILKSSFKQLENGKTYDLIVEAKDSEGGTTTTTAKFIANYNIPTTTSTTKPPIKVHELGVKTWKPLEEKDKHFTIGEDLPADAKWEFRIASGNQSGNFHLNQLNDHMVQLEMVDDQPLNMSSNSMEMIKVEAVNQDDPMETAHADIMVDLRGAMTTTTVLSTAKATIKPKPIIKFLDISSNLQGVIPLNEVNLAQAGQWNPPQPIYRVQAVTSTGEDKVKYSIAENSLTDDLFWIDEQTGNLYLNDKIHNRNAKEEEFELLVKAEAGGISAQRFYTVKVVAGSGRVTEATGTTTPLVQNTTTRTTAQTTELVPASEIALKESQSTTTVQSLETSSKKGEVEQESSTSAIIEGSSQPRFELPNYHFVVDHPVKGAPIGQMKVVTETGRKVQMSIEPPLFQHWFSIDPRTSSLYVRDVPSDRFDKQRAEFYVSIQDVDNPNLKSKSYVKVDLILPPSPSATSSPSQGSGMTGATVSSRVSEEKEDPTSMPFIGQLSDSVASSRPSTITPSKTDQSPTSRPHIVTNIDSRSSSTTPTPNNQPDAPQTTNANSEGSTFFSFPHPLYKAMLPEGRYGSRGALVSLRPQPLKEGMPEGVSYVIHSDQPQLPFYVHNETGELIAFAEIDRETVSEYHFKVIAIDNARRAETDVQISILDVNDNYPVFVTPTAYVLPLDRLTPPGQVLTRFTAKDADEGRLGQVTFRLEEDADGLFQISKTGELVLAKNIPLEQEDVFNVVVAAVDGGRPALKTIHKLRIEVFADSLGKPAFKQPSYTAEKIVVDASPADDSGSFSDLKRQKGTYVGQVVAGTSNFSYDLMPVNDPSLLSAPPGLFEIEKNSGIVRFGRRPLARELNRQYTLNVSATGEDGSSDSTMISVFVEGEKSLETTPNPDLSTSEGPSASVVPASQEGCAFVSKVFQAEIKENVEGKHKLTTVRASGCRPGWRPVYTIHHATAEFYVDANTGEFFVTSPLDREKRSLHFIVVNVTEIQEELSTSHTQPTKRQMTGVNPIVEYTKNKLQEGQALVVVRVIDENDNSPTFARLTPDGLYVFPVDWQANVLQSVARVQAFDPDEKSNLSYTFTHSLADEFFALNKSSGVISVIKSLQETGDEVFNLEVAVSDGTNEARAPVKLYKLQPGTNIVIVESEQSVDKIDELQIVRQLSAALDLDLRVLVKQVYIGEDGHPNTSKSHLLVYALDKLSKVPVDAITLKSMLDTQLPNLKKVAEGTQGPGAEMIQQLVNVTAPLSGAQFHLSFAEFLLLGVSAVLLLMACCLLFLLLRCCKRRQMLTKADLEYMVDSESAGPRPYNVDLITRKMAQSMLSARPLPEPTEEVTMTPESRATMVRHSSSGIYTINNRDGNSAFSSIDNRRDVSLTGADEGEAHHNLVYDSSSTSSESLNQSKCTGARPAPPPSIQ